MSAVLLLIMGVLYTFTVFVGWRNGFGAVTTPFLNLPAEDYYLYETFFCLPVFFLIAVVFGGVSRLLAMAVGGRGNFESNFTVYVTCSVLPMFLTMWLPETVLMVFFPAARAENLGGFPGLPVWLDAVRQIAGIVWPLAVAVVGIRISEKIGVFRSLFVTLATFLVCAGLMIVFIR